MRKKKSTKSRKKPNLCFKAFATCLRRAPSKSLSIDFHILLFSSILLDCIAFHFCDDFSVYVFNCKMRKAQLMRTECRIWPTLVSFPQWFWTNRPPDYVFTVVEMVSPCLQSKGELSESFCALTTSFCCYSLLISADDFWFFDFLMTSNRFRAARKCGVSSVGHW